MKHLDADALSALARREPEAVAYFREHLPAHAQVIEPENLGHCPHFDDPNDIATRILDFARSIT